jgi:hypothetical protein
MPREELEAALRFKGEPVYEAVAPQGLGVFETLKALVKQTLARLRAGVPVG